MPLRWTRFTVNGRTPVPEREVTPAQQRGYRQHVAGKIARHKRDHGPLFAPHIPLEIESFESRRLRLSAEAEQRRKAGRKRQADAWRAARARYHALSAEDRARVRAAWNAKPCPADPVYLLDLMTRLVPTAEDLARRAAARAREAEQCKREPWWIEHTGCGGVVTKPKSQVLRVCECLACGERWEGREAVAAAEAGVLTMIEQPNRVHQGEFQLRDRSRSSDD